MSDEVVDEAVEETVGEEAAPSVVLPEPPATLEQQAARLPRYRNGLSAQSLVESLMLADPTGEWVKRDDVLRLFA